MNIRMRSFVILGKIAYLLMEKLERLKSRRAMFAQLRVFTGIQEGKAGR